MQVRESETENQEPGNAAFLRPAFPARVRSSGSLPPITHSRF